MRQHHVLLLVSKSKHGPAIEQLQAELLSAESVDDFFGKDGIFARLFGQTLEKLMEAELSEHLGYPVAYRLDAASAIKRKGTTQATAATGAASAS